MKKITYIIAIYCCLLGNKNVQAQLLKAGDAVVSMSGAVWTNNTPPASQNYVLEIFRTHNTSAAPNGSTWVMTPGAYAAYSFKHPDWIRSNMGNIFGLTIDNNRNFYATATGFYGTQVSGISTGQVWKMDVNTGAVTAFKDLHSGGQNQNCLGNIKAFGNYLYVSNLADGKIYVIDIANSVANFPPFDPGGAIDIRKPHGLAIRNVLGSPRLFFSLNNFNSTTTEIHSIGISGSNFIGAETTEITGFSSTPNPITDLAFNSDYSRIIMAERSTSSWNSTGAHTSTVYEYMFNGASWVNVNPNYQIGTYQFHKNAAGGISFSKYVLFKDSEKFCDTTIWATSDAIFLSPQSCYGMTGFNHGIGNGSQNGVNIDFDNDFGAYDKTMLGDVEACDTLINCGSCNCGQWGGFMGGALTLTFPPVPPQNISLVKLMNCGSSQSYTQGQVIGALNANYTCSGTCDKIFNWTLINVLTNAQVATGNTMPIQLPQFNNLACGNYKFVITPKCGGINCTPCEFFMNIVCDPPPCCPTKTEVTITPQSATYTSNPNPNTWGTYAQSFTLNSNVQMSEIRIDIEHFELNSKIPDCIPCKNIPKTWGSLLGAAFNGNGFTPANVSLPLNTNYAYSNNRELVYKPGALITINNATLNVNIAMPNASPISCCELIANVCLKITFKDADCRECTYIYCNKDIPITMSAKGNPNGIPIMNVNKIVTKSIL